MHPENVSPCHSMFSVGCRQMAKLTPPPPPSSPPHRTYLHAGVCLLRPEERCQPAFLSLGLLRSELCVWGCVQMLVQSMHSWANSQRLLYSMTCLKWHAGPKRRRPAELRVARTVGHTLITWSHSLKFNTPWIFIGSGGRNVGRTHKWVQ